MYQKKIFFNIGEQFKSFFPIHSGEKLEIEALR